MQIHAIAISFEISISSYLFSMPERSSDSNFIRDTARGLRNNLNRDGRARDANVDRIKTIRLLHRFRKVRRDTAR